MMANLGMADTLILMVLALVVFGPRRLPQIGKQIGKLMYEFRKASNDFKFQMEEELRLSEEADRRKKEEEERQRALAAAPPPAQIEQITEAAATPIEPLAASPTAETPIATPYPETPDAAVESTVATAESEPSTGSEIPAAADAPAPTASIAAESPYANETPLLRAPDAGAEAREQSVAEACAQFRAEASAEAGVETAVESRAEPAPEPPAETSATAEANSPERHEAAPPRIRPPSTGEKVAAERPGTRPEQQKLFDEDAGKIPESVAPEAGRSEPATHHG